MTTWDEPAANQTVRETVGAMAEIHKPGKFKARDFLFFDGLLHEAYEMENNERVQEVCRKYMMRIAIN